MTKLRIVIPVRMASTRLPGKPLAMIAGKTMLQRMCDIAKQAQADSILIATDSAEIVSHAKAIEIAVCFTSNHHHSGTERIAEAVQLQGYHDDDIIINLQGDHPMMPSELIGEVVIALQQHPSASTATLCKAITDKQTLMNPNIVKVVRDETEHALYFSRHPIPWHTFLDSDSQTLPSQLYFWHLGLYAYRCHFVKHYNELFPAVLESCERLEQLRTLYHGHQIVVRETSMDTGIGVDTPEQLQQIQQLLDTNPATAAEN